MLHGDGVYTVPVVRSGVRMPETTPHLGALLQAMELPQVKLALHVGKCATTGGAPGSAVQGGCLQPAAGG